MAESAEVSCAMPPPRKEPLSAVLKQVAALFMMSQINFIFASSMGLSGVFAAQQPFDEDLDLTDPETSSILSMSMFGSVMGFIFACFFAQKFGSRRMIQLSSVPAAIGWTLLALGSQYWILLTGRLLAGIGIGLGMGPSPAYVGEISAERYRSCFMAILAMFSPIGYTATFLVGWKLGWRTVCLMNLMPVAIQFLFSLALHDSAKWIISSGRSEERARVSLKFFRGANYDCGKDISSIRLSLNPDEQLTSVVQVLKEFKKKYVWKPFLLSCILVSFSALSGGTAISSFAPVVFGRLHVIESPYVASMVMALVRLACNFVCSCLTRVVRKRTLLLLNGAAGAACGFLAAGYFYFEQELRGYPWAAVVCLVAIIALVGLMSIGISPMTIAIMTEILPNAVRSTAINICLIVYALDGFIMTYTFKPLLGLIQFSGMFIFFAGMHVLMLIFSAAVLPETGEKSLEEIQEMFARTTDHRNGQSAHGKDTIQRKLWPVCDVIVDCPTGSTSAAL